MRFTWLPLGLALVAPAALLVGGCGPSDTSSSGGGGGTTTTTTTTTTNTGGGGTGGEVGGSTTGGGGTGGTTGGGGTGGVVQPANDLCPGEKVEMAIDSMPKKINGTLKGAFDDYTTFCADTNPMPTAPDVVYELVVPAAATVTLTINATGFIPALSLRKQDCSTRLPGDACLDLGVGNFTTKVALDAGTYWVIVDSSDENVGDFTLDVSYTSGSCGDGAVNGGEQCDPAMVSNDDGCINPGSPNECHYGEPPPDPAIVMCPGGLITIGKGDSFQLGPYNNGSGQHNEANTVTADCVSAAVGPEDVFHITPTGDGTLTAQIGHDETGTALYCDTFPNDCGDFVMYLRKNMCDSADAADQLLCSDFTDNPNSPFGFDELLTITVPVTAGTDYWLVVDGLDDTYGIGGYYLQIQLQ